MKSCSVSDRQLLFWLMLPRRFIMECAHVIHLLTPITMNKLWNWQKLLLSSKNGLIFMPFVVEIRVPGIINDPPISGCTCMSTINRRIIKNTKSKKNWCWFRKNVSLEIDLKKMLTKSSQKSLLAPFWIFFFLFQFFFSKGELYRFQVWLTSRFLFKIYYI